MVAGSVIFASPGWFCALPALALLGFATWKASVAIARRKVAKFLSAERAPEVLAKIDWRQKFQRFVFTVLAGVFLALALARPLTGPKADSDERRGADLVIALDVSKSMWTKDVAPNRLEAVKKALRDWIQQQKADRIGLVLFAGEAFVQAPLTFDTTALDFVIEDAGPASISKGGSNIPKAIETAARMMGNNKMNSKVLLIISDGENLDGDAVAAALQAHQSDGITIYTVGVGTPTGGRVPSFDETKSDLPPPNTPPFVHNEYGAEVISRLNSQALRAIASVGGGTYYEFRPSEPTFQRIRDQSISPLMEKNRKINARDYDEWFQIPLGAAILLMVLEPFLCRSRKRSATRQTGVAVIKPANYSPAPKIVAARSKTVATALLLLAACLAQDARADDPLGAGVEKLFAEGKGGEAVEYLHTLADQNPTDPYLSYNYGLGLYRVERLDEAERVFQTVEVLAASPDLKALALFQMANIQYRIGHKLKSEKQAGVGAARAFEQALGNYQAALALNPSDDARFNSQLTGGQLEETLLAIAAERTRVGTETTLRQALEAYERAAELNAKNQSLVVEARKRLSQELAKNARALDEQADRLEAAQKDIDDKAFKEIFPKREDSASKYGEAAGLMPDKALEDSLRKVQEKMSDLLTKAAGQQAASALEQNRFFSNNHLNALKGASQKLDQAMMLNGRNEAAKSLSTTINAKLVDAYVENGGLALGHLKKSLAAEEKEPEAAAASPSRPQEDGKQKNGGKQKDDGKGQNDVRSQKKAETARDENRLENARRASSAFNSALALDPNRKEAREGLEEVNGLLAQLYAKVGTTSLAEAETTLGQGQPGAADSGQEGRDDEQPAPSPDDTAQPGGPLSQGQAPQGQSPADGKSEGTLRSAAATLEKARTNLGAASGLQPENEDYKNALTKAESLLSSVRGKLDEIAQAKGPGGEDEAGGAGETGGKEPGQEGEGEGPKSGKNASSLRSVSGLRAKPGGGGEGGTESKRYWDRRAKDW